ncbi:hypothetical protein BJ944DRAFT_242045 [Cunninghamella echinulata]|nr:hypothetical protein BJ944DRAFT_242045 [Cunninghamella echinulata]
MDYSNKFTPNEPSFWRLCDDNICHCDFRLTINNCVESKALYIINIVDIIWSAVATAIAISVLYYRVVHKNQQIFDTTDRFPRPKPIESRLIHSIILVTDVVKNGIFRSFMFEFSWQFGITALACYLFGVVHTLASSSRAIYMSWVKSQMLVDIACVFMVVSPSLTIVPMSIVTGYYTQNGDIEKAVICTNIIYYLWLFFTFLLGCMVLLAGLRLLRLLNTHLLTKKNVCQENIEKMKLGTTKVKLIIGIGCFCLWAFSIMIAIYATSRHSVMLDSKFTIIITGLAFFNGPLATSLIELSVLMDLKVFRGLSNLSFGTMLGSSVHNNTAKSGGDFSSLSFSTTLVASTCENKINTTKDHGSQPYVKKYSCDRGVRSTITSETIQLDTWSHTSNKKNNAIDLENATINYNNNNNNNNNSNSNNSNNNSFALLPPPPPIAQRQRLDTSISISSSIQQQSDIMTIDGVDRHHHPLSSFSQSSLDNETLLLRPE